MQAPLTVSVPDERLRDALSTTEGIELLVWNMREPAPRPHIDIVVPPYVAGTRVLAALEGVSTQLVQWQSIGVDRVAEHLPEGILLANATTVHETATAEMAVGLTIAMQRGFVDAVRAMSEGQWNLRFRPGLADQRVLLVGYGGVAKAIESRLAPFEVSITRVASTARDTAGLQGETVHVNGIDELPELLATHDIVIIGLPHTPSTERLFNAEMLGHMPDGALLINVGRGPVVDTHSTLR